MRPQYAVIFFETYTQGIGFAFNAHYASTPNLSWLNAIKFYNAIHVVRFVGHPQ